MNRMQLVAFIALLAFARVASAGIETSYRAEVKAKQAEVTSRVAGKITRVWVHDRQSVKQGDPLVKLDDADLQARLAVAQADLAARQADLARAGAKARVEVERTAVELARARVKQAEVVVELAQLDLQYATIKAEISGTITLGGISLGQGVQRQQALATIVDVDHAWVDAFFQEPQLAHMAVGQAAYVAAGGASLRGAVTDIDRDGAALAHTIADPVGSSVGVRVQIELRDKPSGLWPGMAASVRVHTP